MATNALQIKEKVNGPSYELAMTRQESEALQMIQAQVILAKRFPRDEDEAYRKILRACQRPAFAKVASYSFPRGGKAVKGPSAYLARQMKRCWGNIVSGTRVIWDDDEKLVGEAVAWDLETNAREYQEFTVRKRIWRKGGWMPATDPDFDRQVRELFNNMGARAERNCILQILPEDFKEDAVLTANKTVLDGVKKDPEGERKAIIVGFDELNISVTAIEEFLGHPLKEATPTEIVQLRAVWKSLEQGETKWADWLPEKKPEAVKKTINPEDLKPSADANRGHDGTQAEQEGATDGPSVLNRASFTDDEWTTLIVPFVAHYGCRSEVDRSEWLAKWEAPKAELLAQAKQYVAAQAKKGK